MQAGLLRHSSARLGLRPVRRGRRKCRPLGRGKSRGAAQNKLLLGAPACNLCSVSWPYAFPKSAGLCTECPELFVQYLATYSYKHGRGKEKSALTYSDLSHTAEECETFQFLADILPKKILASKYLKMLEKEKRDGEVGEDEDNDEEDNEDESVEEDIGS
nr:PREDICTED: chromatin accessibility complex protein 1 [Apteryx mantelli mantelli]